MIRARNLEVSFGDVRALRLESLDVEMGERGGIYGPNGSGKSTALRVLASLIEPTSGSVVGCPPPGETVLVHQAPYFFRGTALDNVRLALSLRGLPVSDAERWLARVGAASLAGRTARRLSGGEGRRVAVARALAARPRLLLLDEPFTGLDSEGRESVRAAIEAHEGTVVITAPEPDPDLEVRPLATLEGS